MKLPWLADITLEEIVTGLDENHFTSVHLVKAYIARINEVQQDFLAVLELNKDALHIANELDQERKQGKKRGPLHGVPILLKDNIYTHDSMMASAGSFALLGSQTAHEATVATKLRAVGAILLGKTNLSEWSDFRCSAWVNGWSPRGGHTTGVYYPGMDAEGSSSGSGVAATLGLCWAAVGTETDGSIVNPSEKSSIVGIKPTVALVARDGVIPISEPQDSVGPMARTVKDAAYLLTALAGKSPFDNYTTTIPFETIPDYAAACQSTALAGIRIGVPRNSFTNVNPTVLSAFDKAIDVFATAGAIIVDHANYACMEEWEAWPYADQMSVLEADFQETIAKFCSALVTNPNDIRTLDDMIAFTKSHPEENYPSRDIGRWLNAQRAAALPSEEIRLRREKSLRCSKEDGILGAIETGDLDVIIAPSVFTASTTFAARAGLPIITVPLDYHPVDAPVIRNKRGDLIETGPNIPFCISFHGKAYSEQTLIRVAYAFEQLTHVRSKAQPIRVPRTELCDVL